MIALLDVDVLVALFDPAHVHHDVAHGWLADHRSQGWATCPITENGFVRVLSNPAYPGRRTTVADATARLRSFTESGNHHFWPDSVSVRDTRRMDPGKLSGHRQITDAYLLALAVENGGRLATFDSSLPLDAVRDARPGGPARLTPPAATDARRAAWVVLLTEEL